MGIYKKIIKTNEKIYYDVADAQYRRVKGVVKVRTGYTRPDNLEDEKVPTYKSVCAGDGNMEGILVEYDTRIISTDKVLDVFFDRGSHSCGSGQYGSAILCSNEEQLEAVLDRYEREKAKNKYLTVTISDSVEFKWTDAEEYHQNYYGKSRFS